MASKKLKIKHFNDFVLGILMLVIGLCISFLPDVVVNISSRSPGGFFVRPDVYLKFLSLLLSLFAVILTIKSIGFVESDDEVNKFKFYLNKQIVFSTITLILYALLLDKIGFAFCTSLMVFVLVYLFSSPSLAEIIDPACRRKETRKLLFIDLAYTIVLVVTMYLMFKYLFGISLP